MPRTLLRRPRTSSYSLGALLAFAMFGGCQLPSDASGGLRVEMLGSPVLSLGDTVQLRSQIVGASGVVVPNAAVTYTSDDPGILLVDATGRLIAVRRGFVTVTAVSRDYGAAQSASERFRVRDPRFDIDSVRPKIIHSGALVRIYGAGLADSTIVAVIFSGKAGTLIGNPPPDQGGTNVFEFFAPLTTAGPVTLNVYGNFGQRTTTDTLTFIPSDLYEPNDTVPADLGVIDTTWHQPWMVFEPGADSARDRYTFTTTTSHSVQVRIISALDQSLSTVELSDSLGAVGAAGGWVISNQRRSCGTSVLDKVDPRAIDADPSLRVTYQDLPAGRYYFRVSETPRAEPVAYTLIIEAGSDVNAGDAFEEDDNCQFAPVVTLPIVDQRRTLDHPTDVDWVRFDVAPPGATLSASATPDSLAITFGLYRTDQPPGPTKVALASSLNVVLSPGSYALSTSGRRSGVYRMNVSQAPLPARVREGRKP